MNILQLIAAGFDPVLIKFVLVVVFLLISVLGSLFKKAVQPPPAAPKPGPSPNRGPTGRSLNDEVDAFLRQARNKPAGGPSQTQARPAPRPNKPQRQQKPVRPQVVEATMAPGSRRQPALQDMGDSVAAGASEVGREADLITQQADRLGQQIDQSDAQADQHVRSVFDHQLGQLSDTSGSASADVPQGAQQGASPSVTSTAADDATADMAAQIRQIFANPHDIRRATIMAEILAPPSDRW